MKNRSYVSNFTLNVANKISTVGKLWAVRATEQKYKLCTPDYRRVKQVFLDETTGELYEQYQLVRGIEQADGSYLPVGENEDISDARESQLPKNILSLTAHYADQVDEHLFPSKNQGYFFEVLSGKKGPNPTHLQNYQLIRLLMNTPNLALLGKCNLQGNEGLFRVGVFRNQLYIQKQLYPEDLNTYEFESYEFPDILQRTAEEVAPKLARDFTPDMYRNDVADRLFKVATGTFSTPSEMPFDALFDALKELADV